MLRRHSTTILFIVLFLLLAAFAPLYATALPEGRTLDEGHESGYIDWSGPIEYNNFWHRDSLCPLGCFEEVTRIGSGGSVSGSFQSGVDVNYFEVMVARSGSGSFGTATITACSSTMDVFLGTGGATPGFNSLPMYVPPGCTSWSLSASGGDVYFRSVDANYSAPSLPPVISGSLACTNPGNSGWCLDGQSLHLEAADPQGQPIIIYGKISGVDFSCPSGATTCDVPVTVQGAGTAQFTVLNPATGLSDSDALPYKLDTSTPQIDLTITGASGLNSWYVSTVTTTASASDAISGLASLEVAVDGGTWQPNGPLTLNDGLHTVSARAYDVAGNVTEITQNINVDTLTPVLNVSVNGVAGQNGWYLSQTDVTAAATDPGSGLASLEVAVNGGAWQAYSPQSLSDGVHTLQFRATDNAGNVTTANQDVKVDTLTPSLSLTVSGTAGLNGWYVSAVQVTATATDVGSGTGVIEASVNGGAWSAFSGPLSFTDGVYSYQVLARDQAGNVTQTPVQSLKVDTIAPFIDMPKTISLGKRLEYILQDDGSGLAIFRAVVEDDAEKYKKIVWLKTLSGNLVEDDILWDGKFKDGTQAAPGEYFITLKISDAAGNERMKTTIVKVNLLNSLLPLPPFVPPTSAPEPVYTPQAASTPVTFGGEPGVLTGQPAPFTFSAGGGSAGGKTTTTQMVSQPSQNTNVPISTGGILWGAASAAAVGYFVSETQKRKEEEEQKRREAAETQQQALAQTFLEDKKPEPKKEKPPQRSNKKDTLTEQERLQAIWDANGARLYEMKQAEQKAAAAQPKKSTVSAPAKPSLWNKITSAGKAVYVPVASTIKKIVTPVKSTPAPAKPNLWNKLTSAVKAVVTPAKSVPTPIVSTPAKPSLWNSFTSAVKKVTAPVVNTVKKVVTPIVNTIQKVVTPALNTVKKIVTPIVNTVKKVVTPIVNTVKNVVTSVVNTVKKVVTSVVNTVKKVVTPIVNTVKKVVTPVVNTVKSVFQEHPAVAWTGAATLTTAAAVGTYAMICGVPTFIQPVSAVFNVAGVFSLPLTGWFTANKKRRGYGVLIGMLFFGMILSACQGGVPVVPSGTASPSVTVPPDVTVSPSATTSPESRCFSDSKPWQAFVGNPGELNTTNWKDISGQSVLAGQNNYNEAIYNAQTQTKIPAWIIKAVMARESEFNPYPDPNKTVVFANAKGLMQITPMGMDALWRLDNGDYSSAIQHIKSLMSVHPPEGQIRNASDFYLNGGGALNFQYWYKNILVLPENSTKDEQSALLNYKITLAELGTHILDGDCTNRDLGCTQGTQNPSEIDVNVLYGAKLLALSQQEVQTIIAQRGSTCVSADDQLLLMVANYQASVGGGEGGCVGKAIVNTINQGKELNWNNVKGNIPDSDDTQCGASIRYAEDILNYANQGGK